MKDLFKTYLTIKMFDYLKDQGVKNRMLAPGGNMGLSRSTMPQIASNLLPEYMRWMNKKGVQFKEKLVKTRDLKLVQSEYNKDKVLSLMKLYRSKKEKPEPPLVSSDGFVIDGSHRFLAVHNNDLLNGEMVVNMANKKATEVLELTKSFPGAQYRTWSDKKV